MKKIILISTIFITFTATGALALWTDDFIDIYRDSGIDEAVVEALKQGAGPDDIMKEGLQFEELNPQNLVKAMYCSGISGDDIRVAGQKRDVSELIIVAGYKKSVEECSDQIADSQAYTPVASVVSFLGSPLPGGGDSISPSAFIQ